MAEEHYYPEQLKRDAQILGRHDSGNPKINILKNRFTGLEDHIFQKMKSSKRTNNSKKSMRRFNKK